MRNSNCKLHLFSNILFNNRENGQNQIEYEDLRSHCLRFIDVIAKIKKHA